MYPYLSILVHLRASFAFTFVRVHVRSRLLTQMDKQRRETKELIKNLVRSCRHKANRSLASVEKTKELVLLFTQLEHEPTLIYVPISYAHSSVVNEDKSVENGDE